MNGSGISPAIKYTRLHIRNKECHSQWHENELLRSRVINRRLSQFVHKVLCAAWLGLLWPLVAAAFRAIRKPMQVGLVCIYSRMAQERKNPCPHLLPWPRMIIRGRFNLVERGTTDGIELVQSEPITEWQMMEQLRLRGEIDERVKTLRADASWKHKPQSERLRRGKEPNKVLSCSQMIGDENWKAIQWFLVFFIVNSSERLGPACIQKHPNTYLNDK